MREKVIELIEKFLKEENTRIFFNENEFQLYLAIFLQGKGYNVFVEYKVEVPYKGQELVNKIAALKKQNRAIPSNLLHSIYLDIVVEKDGRYMPIELKYKTTGKNNFPTGVDTFGNGEPKRLETQGAHNDGCYDFWRDVERVESMAREYENVELGVAVILTNDQQYWTLPHTAKAGNPPVEQVDCASLKATNVDYLDFCLKNGRTVAALSQLYWQKKRDSPKHHLNVIDIEQEHTIEWVSTGLRHVVSDKKAEEFMYLILPK